MRSVSSLPSSLLPPALATHGLPGAGDTGEGGNRPTERTGFMLAPAAAGLGQQFRRPAAGRSGPGRRGPARGPGRRRRRPAAPARGDQPARGAAASDRAASRAVRSPVRGPPTAVTPAAEEFGLGVLPAPPGPGSCGSRSRSSSSGRAVRLPARRRGGRQGVSRASKAGSASARPGPRSVRRAGPSPGRGPAPRADAARSRAVNTRPQYLLQLPQPPAPPVAGGRAI